MSLTENIDSVEGFVMDCNSTLIALVEKGEVLLSGLRLSLQEESRAKVLSEARSRISGDKRSRGGKKVLFLLADSPL